MSYAIHITRAEEWTRSAKTPISLGEWRAVIATDPTLECDDQDEPAADWSAHPDSMSRPLFRWIDGRIEVERPDEATVAKALALAKTLQAQVIGDDGETYHQPSTPDGSRAAVIDRQTLLAHALSRGWFHGGWVRRGVVPRRVRLTVHSLDGRNYFLIVVYRSGSLRDVDHRTPMQMIPLSPDLKIEPHGFFGRTIGFRLQANGERLTVRVKEPEKWIQWLRNPDQSVDLPIT